MLVFTTICMTSINVFKLMLIIRVAKRVHLFSKINSTNGLLLD